MTHRSIAGGCIFASFATIRFAGLVRKKAKDRFQTRGSQSSNAMTSEQRQPRERGRGRANLSFAELQRR